MLRSFNFFYISLENMWKEVATGYFFKSVVTENNCTSEPDWIFIMFSFFFVDGRIFIFEISDMQNAN